MTVVMLLVCRTRRGDFGYIGGHMQLSYVYVQLSDCSDHLHELLLLLHHQFLLFIDFSIMQSWSVVTAAT